MMSRSILLLYNIWCCLSLFLHHLQFGEVVNIFKAKSEVESHL